MRKSTVIGVGSLMLAAAIFFHPLGAAQSPLPPSETMAAARQQQALGRFIVAPDGSFFVYEWSRPYNWSPSARGLPRGVAQRHQTLLFKVQVPDRWRLSRPAPTSFEWFPMAPGATYYLGSLSPNGLWLSFYELDRDDNRIRAGVAAISDDVPPRIVWFDLPPDLGRLDRPASWESDSSLVYPIAGNARFARVDVASGQTLPCPNCSLPSASSPAIFEGTVDREGIPSEARLVGRSANGSLNIYALDTQERLSLYYRKAGRTVELFDNSRSAQSVGSSSAGAR